MDSLRLLMHARTALLELTGEQLRARARPRAARGSPERCKAVHDLADLGVHAQRLPIGTEGDAGVRGPAAG